MKIAASRMRDREYERYQAFELFEYERRWTDEVTDMSERLAAPMRNTFEYDLGEDGELWFQGEAIGRVFDDGIRVAEELTRTDARFSTELVRRHLERQEYDEMRRLAMGSDGDPDVLVIMSPIPDVVLEGLQLNAYDVERKKTLVRIFQRTEKGIEATSLSLDLSDRDGLCAIAERFGESISSDASSEDILAMRFWGNSSEQGGDTVKTVRTTYDDALTKKWGGRWYAGRQDSDVLDAREFIETQSSLMEQHMKEIAMLKKKLTGVRLDAELEEARYNLAAALARRMRGDEDAGSLSEAGAEARAKGETYSGDCPTGIEVTVQQSLSELGLGKDEHMRCVTCPICGARGVDGIVSGSTIRCSKNNCTVDRRTGEVLRGPGGTSRSTGPAPEAKPRRRSVESVFGMYAEERVISSVGSAETLIFDRRNGVAIARKTAAGYASL